MKSGNRNVYFQPCKEGKVHTYATTESLKIKEFVLNNENIKPKTGIQLSFFFEIKFQKEHFLAKYHPFSKHVRMGKYIRMSRLKK